MPVHFSSGNILFTYDATLTVPVNTEGVLGAGLALQFKRLFTDCVPPYITACLSGSLMPGTVLLAKTKYEKLQYIAFFATKGCWRNSSKLEYIESGLSHLYQQLNALNIPSVSIPALGCGLGQLDWHIVKPLIVDAANSNPRINTTIFQPQ